MRKYPRPEIGDQYGEWTVLEVPEGATDLIHISCRCSCGRFGTPTIHNLVQGLSIRCTYCGRRTPAMRTANSHNIRAAVAARTRYGFVPRLHRTRIRHCVANAIRRCHNSRCKFYADYGARGISVHPAWRQDRTLFARYLMTLDGWDNSDLTIDRIDNNGNYEPGNLRWATIADNNRNRSRRIA